MSFHISLSVIVETDHDFNEVWNEFTVMQRKLAKELPQAALTSTYVEGEEELGEELINREGTLFLVQSALLSQGLDEQQMIDAITAMQEDGVVFRERKK